MDAIRCAWCERLALVRCAQCRRYVCGEHSQVVRLPLHAGATRRAVRVYCLCCQPPNWER